MSPNPDEADPIPPTEIDRFVDENFIAAMLSVSAGYLANLRSRGGGPRFYNLGKSGRGRCVRYRLSEVLAWAESRAATSTSSYEG